MTVADIDDLTRTIRTKITVCDCSCWLWTGSVNAHGYAKAKLKGKTFLVHRFVYDRLVGPLDDDMTIDHLCDRHRNCVNPAHFEQVSLTENSIRANERRWRTNQPTNKEK